METRSFFYCPNSPLFLWEFKSITSHQITLAITSVTCPAIILLNILVIIAVKTRGALKRTSTIPLSSLAVADLLVGVVSMPLTIALDAFVLQKRFDEAVFCAIDYVNDFLMYITFCASFYHLFAIAWERYVAIHKWRHYQNIVTKSRISKCIVIAWVCAFLTVVPKGIMAGVGVRWEAIFAADIIISSFAFICLLLIGYFYVMVCRGVRRWNRSQIRQVNDLIKSKYEIKVAFTISWLTVFALLSIVPTFAVFVVGRSIVPKLRTSSFFRWSEVLLQLNSLLNPFLYCYSDYRFRIAVLELSRIQKPQRIQPLARSLHTRHRDTRASLDFGKIEERPHLKRSQSCAAVLCVDVFRGDWHRDSVPPLLVGELGLQRPRLARSQSCGLAMCTREAVPRMAHGPHMERSMSSSSSSSDATRQPTKLTVMVQIETVARMKAMRDNAGRE